MEKLLAKSLEYSRLILIITIILTVALFVIMKNNSRMETDLDKYMPQQHPAFVYSNQAEDWFNIKDGIIIAIENKGGIYNSGTLEKVKSLSKALQKMKEIEKSDVTSLYTADNIIGTADGMDVRRFYKKTPKDDYGLQRLKQDVRGNEMVFGRLVSNDETVTIIIAEIADDLFSQEFYHEILETVKRYEGPEKIYVAGRPIIEGTMAYLGPRDMKRMIPIVVLVIIIVLLSVLRSFKATLFTLIVVLFSTIWTFGLMAALNIPIYAVSTMIPVMLIAIGVADGIHLYSHLHLYLVNNPDASRKEAALDMIKGMWKPVVMTSVTTAIGFVSLLTSQVYPIKYFGVFTAFGVLMAMMFSLILIPAGLISFGLPGWKRRPANTDNDIGSFASVFALKIIKHKYLTIIATVVVIVVSAVGIERVWINSSFLEKFETDSEIVLTDKFINQHFGGTSTLNVILDANNRDSFKRPEILKAVEDLQSDVEGSLDVVGNSFALTDYLKRMNKVMHADDEKYNVIPESNNLIAQYLLLYEMSGDPDNLWKVVDYNYQKANLTFQLKSDNSKAINSAINIIERHIPRFDELNVELKYAGSGYKGLVFSDLILKGQISSLFLSLIIIIILLSFMFRKVTIGLIGSIPIVTTACISFGVMGLMNIPLSTTTALLSSIAIGIGIDYAVHFLEKYKILAAETGDKLLTGRRTMSHSGRAIAFNAIVVISGFLVLLFSVFPPNRALGALVSLNMFTSFLGTVTIMFAVLYLSNMFFNKKETVFEKSDHNDNKITNV